MNKPNILLLSYELSRNSYIGKYKHFIAARRFKNYYNFLGILTTIISIFLGSLFFLTISKDLPAYSKWIGALLALLAAVSSGIQTFFNFNKTFEAHRKIANKYLKIAVDIQLIIATYEDKLIDSEELQSKYTKLKESYDQINIEAESFLTSKKDFSRALDDEDKRESSIRNRNNDETK